MVVKQTTPNAVAKPTDNGKKPLNLKRKKTSEAPTIEEPASVSAGPVDKVIELAFNPSREKIREMTIIDRTQGRLLPQLDIIDLMWQNSIEIAAYREDSATYLKTYHRNQPVPPNLINEFSYRTAQWQKSIAGKNLERATDIALAETEAKAGEDEDLTSDPDKYLKD